MSDAVAELATRLRLSDPKPSHCSGCWQSPGPDVQFVDFDCMLDRGVVVAEGTMAVLDALDSLHLCESCVRQAAEVLAYKPDLHRRQLTEIRRLEIEVEHWREYARRIEEAVHARPLPAAQGRRR